MKPEHALIIDAYCKWLNLVTKENDPEAFKDSPYEPKNFDTDPYGYHGEIQRCTEGSWYLHITLEVSNGDEGGPSILNAWLRGDGVEAQGDEFTIEYATNEFDTMLGVWLWEGKLVNTKGFDKPVFNGTEELNV